MPHMSRSSRYAYSRVVLMVARTERSVIRGGTRPVALPFPDFRFAPSGLRTVGPQFTLMRKLHCTAGQNQAQTTQPRAAALPFRVEQTAKDLLSSEQDCHILRYSCVQNRHRRHLVLESSSCPCASHPKAYAEWLSMPPPLLRSHS